MRRMWIRKEKKGTKYKKAKKGEFIGNIKRVQEKKNGIERAEQ